MLKIRSKRQITRLGSKFRGPRKAIGPIDNTWNNQRLSVAVWWLCEDI